MMWDAFRDIFPRPSLLGKKVLGINVALFTLYDGNIETKQDPIRMLAEPDTTVAIHK